MESIAIKVVELLWAKSDPLLIACILILGYWQYKTNAKLNAHLNPDNEYPHPACRRGEDNYKNLKEMLEGQHRENREDHQRIFTKLENKDDPRN